MSTTTRARLAPAHDRLAVQDHHLQRHADGVGQAVHHHAHAVADQQQVAMRVQQGRRRRVIGGQADDGLPPFSRLDVGGGDATDRLLNLAGHAFTPGGEPLR